MSPSPARGGVGEKSRHLRKDGSAYLARKILKKKKRPNTPVSGGFSGRSPLSANSNNGASSYSHLTGSANSLRRRKLKQEEDEADLSKMLDDSVISSNGAFIPSKANAVGSSVYDYRSASKAAYDKLLRLVDSEDEEEEDMFA